MPAADATSDIGSSLFLLNTPSTKKGLFIVYCAITPSSATLPEESTLTGLPSALTIIAFIPKYSGLASRKSFSATGNSSLKDLASTI